MLMLFLRHADAFLGLLRRERQRGYELTGIGAYGGNNKRNKERVDGDVVAQTAGIIRVGHGDQHVAHGIREDADNAQAGKKGVKRLEPNLTVSHVFQFILWRVIK